MAETGKGTVVGVSGRRMSLQTLQTMSVFLLLVVLCVISSVRTDTFFTWRNIVDNLLTNAAYLGVIASVASITAVCSVVAVLILQALAPHGAWLAIPIALAASLAVGTALGAVNGALVAYVGVNPFVVTLSTMLVFRGLALVLTHGGQSIVVPLATGKVFRAFYWGRINVFGTDVGYFTVPMAVFAVVFVLFYIALRYARYGHYVYAVGGNETASWLAGINTARVKALTYTLCGLTCGIAALVYTGMSNTAQAASFQGLEMKVIASVIVGGTPLGGGSGGLWYTLIGLVLLAVIENLLSQFGVTEEYRNIVRGMIILVVVAVDVAVRRGGMKGKMT